MIFLLALLLITPLPNASVAVTPGGAATTDPQGKWSLQVDTPWNGTVSAAYPGCAFDPVSLPVAVTADTTLPPLACLDVQAPSVRITYPAGSTVPRQLVTLACAASDNIAVARVQWSLDGATLGTVYAAPWSLGWNAAKLHGQHTLKATAFDAAGNSASATMRVKVQ